MYLKNSKAKKSENNSHNSSIIGSTSYPKRLHLAGGLLSWLLGKGGRLEFHLGGGQLLPLGWCDPLPWQAVGRSQDPPPAQGGKPSLSHNGCFPECNVACLLECNTGLLKYPFAFWLQCHWEEKFQKVDGWARSLTCDS